MAERAGVMANVNRTWSDSFTITWSGLLNGDTGTGVLIPYSEGMCFQVAGTFGSGGSVTLKGSNDGTNYIALTDPQGNAITKTSAAIEQVEEKPLYIRPEVTAGDGTTDLVVTVLVNRR